MEGVREIYSILLSRRTRKAEDEDEHDRGEGESTESNEIDERKN